MILRRFFRWWESKLQISLGFLVFTHIAQIPHFLWGGDALVKSGYVYNVNPIYDFILYGIDLIGITAIVVVCISFVARWRKNDTKR